jgi:glycosyltransferase involved in cell wall biosynthesis
MTRPTRADQMTRPTRTDGRVPVLHLAPWVDFGGTDKGSIDWFRWLDRDRYAPSLVTTQPSANRRLHEVVPYAEEVWPLPELMGGYEMPTFIFDFIHSRGVQILHVMNSRLGFDLLPDLGALASRPRVVVQLHVEEADRTGYVRYVTTRYGNLVDAFSVTSEHLAETVYEYGISRDRIRVIHTGVDAEEEFSPSRGAPVAGLAADRVHVLYPGRLVEQKDPLLMVDVATLLRDRGHAFQIHAVGEGELEGEVRRRIDERRLGEHVLIHPATNQLQPWYAASDVLLMTSVFEGVPYVVYEAMAMALPVVTPALAGNVELLGDVAGGLIEPRDDVEAYAAALGSLIESAERRNELGRRGRERVQERFSVMRMADEHVRLYDELLAKERSAHAAPTSPPAERAAPPPLRFRNRSLFGSPLVSVIVPCFNQGRLLPECLDAIRAQTYSPVETIVVDDASTERETIERFAGLERDEDLTVIRLSVNGGPSHARNVALERCRGRYVLPVDSDNVLLPDAIEKLIGQLRVAGEDVGFIYPNIQYFGNRDDYYEALGWDVYGLLHRNAYDVCSLFDREIFDAGERFDETIRLGHEDWEFVLRLAARGMRGEPAHAKTLLYRKWGFNRSDSVEYLADPFHESVRKLSPLTLYEDEIKAEWSPALSLIALEPADPATEAGQRLAERLAEQSSVDAELIVRYDGEWPRVRRTTPLRLRSPEKDQLPAVPEAPPVRRLPAGLALSPGQALLDARSVMLGRLIAVTAGTGSALLADPGFVEKVLRVFQSASSAERPIDAIVLADGGGHDRIPLGLLGDDAGRIGPPHSVIWSIQDLEDHLLTPLAVDPHDPVHSLVDACVAAGQRVQWRHLPAPAGRRTSSSGQPVPLKTAAELPERERELMDERIGRPPRVSWPKGWLVPRWVHQPTWMPPQSTVLCRHRERGGARRVVTCEREPPHGFELEYDLGQTRIFSLQGTSRLIALEGGGYATAEPGDTNGEPPRGRTLGYVERAAFPLLEALVLGRHRATGEQVLVCGPWDPLAPEVDPLATLGFIEPFPVSPRWPPHAERSDRLVGLTAAVDHEQRRHRYAAGRPAEGDPVGELGALLAFPQPGATPLWIVDGFVVTGRHTFQWTRPPLAKAARWSLAPLTWPGLRPPLPATRAVARRSGISASRLLRAPRRRRGQPTGDPAGWLFDRPMRVTVPLYAAYHPVTADQLLSRNAWEAPDMGYGPPELLGYLRDRAPVTGVRELRAVPLRWASRYGLRTARG